MTQVTPPPLPEPAPVLPYAVRPPQNNAAVVSVVCGALLFVPLLGIAAIYFGVRGRAAAEQGLGRGRMARTGIVLGVLNLAFTGLITVVLALTIGPSRRAAENVACEANLRSIGQAVQMYAAQNGGYFPPSLDHLPPIFGMKARPAAGGVFACPACAGDPTKKPATATTIVTSNYIYTPPAPRIVQIRTGAASTVMAYEPLTNHDGRGSNVLFVDGHVAYYPAPVMTKILSELSAGQNPPPSAK